MKRREMNGCYEQQSEKKKYNNSIEVILFISILGKKPCKKSFLSFIPATKFVVAKTADICMN